MRFQLLVIPFEICFSDLQAVEQGRQVQMNRNKHVWLLMHDSESTKHFNCFRILKLMLIIFEHLKLVRFLIRFQFVS